jgi:hypothetical protein
MVRPVDKSTGDQIRTDIVRFLLAQIVAGMKPRLDWIEWINAGWIELEDFAAALNGGGQHPALVTWQTDKESAGRPAPSVRELYARRVVTLLCTALERAGLGKKEAREFAADKLNGVFDPPPSERTIRYWQDEQPDLSRQEELLIAGGFAAAGGDPDRLAIYFVALMHLALNPTATAVAKKGGDYFGSVEGG